MSGASCDGKQLPISPNICGAAGIIATADQDGNLSNFTKLGDTSVYALPANGEAREDFESIKIAEIVRDPRTAKLLQPNNQQQHIEE